MKRFKGIAFGGIRQKVFNLVIVTILLTVAVFIAVIVYQYGQLSGLVKKTNESQKQSITAISEEMMAGILETNVTQSTQMEAYIAADVFGDAERVVKIVADYTGKLFSDPDSYPVREVYLPDKAMDGKISVQLLTEEGIDLTDPDVKSKLGLIGNLSDLMTAVYADSNVDSCYCALPEGVMLLVDNHSGTKFDKDGNLVPIPVRERLWYTGAVESGKLGYTDVTTDIFTGEVSIMCSLPVYCDGELVAVIGADLFLNDVSETVYNMAQRGSFICIVNQNGHVIFSPRKEGIFRVVHESELENNPESVQRDLRETDNKELSQFVRDSLAENTELRLVEADGQQYYMAGAPIRHIGWAVLSLVPKSYADQPSVFMVARFNEIQNDAVNDFSSGMKSARLTFFVLIGIVAAIVITAAVFVSTRIVKPLAAITKRVQSLGGDNLQFKMEDEYRTGDEIQVLAESFAMLSGKTLEYIDQVKKVTAEKERIGAELSLATRIQADMLPNVYPAFPERNEFDIYASMDPAKEVGGDFYDYFLVDRDHLCVFIADVSGKGVPAALFMMASKIILANYAKMGKSPAQILHDTNNAICANNREEMFVTVWLGILEISTGKLLAANAGHEYPVIKRPEGGFEILKDKHGLVIGGMDNANYKEYEIQMEPGSKLFLYTDGVPEATLEEKELFGMDRMLDALNELPDASPKETLDNVRRVVDSFVRDSEQFDDLTMMCIEYKGKNS